jgi:hypothetical protein
MTIISDAFCLYASLNWPLSVTRFGYTRHCWPLLVTRKNTSLICPYHRRKNSDTSFSRPSLISFSGIVAPQDMRVSDFSTPSATSADTHWPRFGPYRATPFSTTPTQMAAACAPGTEGTHGSCHALLRHRPRAVRDRVHRDSGRQDGPMWYSSFTNSDYILMVTWWCTDLSTWSKMASSRAWESIEPWQCCRSWAMNPRKPLSA